MPKIGFFLSVRVGDAPILFEKGIARGGTRPDSGALLSRSNDASKSRVNDTQQADMISKRQRLALSLCKFASVRVWFPYLLNQAGSLLYYVAFSQTDLSLLVPICNALALVFSIGTSVWIGESIQRPLQTTVGCGLIMMGVALCLVAQNDVVWDDDDVK